MKALIIDEPWLGKILQKAKTWEMRKTGCWIRGRIGLIRKGSGQVVGVADLVDCRAPLRTRKAYAAAQRHHCIPLKHQASALANGYKFPWVLANAQPLPRPVSYRHPSGAVIWVNLKPSVEAKIVVQMSGTL